MLCYFIFIRLYNLFIVKIHLQARKITCYKHFLRAYWPGFINFLQHSMQKIIRQKDKVKWFYQNFGLNPDIKMYFSAEDNS